MMKIEVLERYRKICWDRSDRYFIHRTDADWGYWFGKYSVVKEFIKHFEKQPADVARGE